MTIAKPAQSPAKIPAKRSSTSSSGKKKYVYLCKHPSGCKKHAKSSPRNTGKEGMCSIHGGGNRCEHINQDGTKCDKSAQSSSRNTGKEGMCSIHGGGNRCEHINQDSTKCGKSAVSSSRNTGKENRCKSHGGGDRCEHINQDGTKCGKSARSSSRNTGKEGMCSIHGGGDRCEHINQDGTKCGKSARTSSRKTGKEGMCKTHGGGNRCEHINQDGTKCCKSAVSSSRNTGKEDRCKSHGGGDRCEDECCTPFATRNFAEFKHPDGSGRYICRGRARFLVNQALMEENDKDKYKKLQKHFGFKKDLILRAEHAFYHQLVKREPRLASLMARALDEPVSSSLGGKQKSLKNLRPDYFHFYPPTNMALYGEFDETDDHEDDDDRLAQITREAGCGLERTYIFRVRAKLNTPDALLNRVTLKNSTVYYEMTPKGKQMLNRVVAHTRQCIDNMMKGVLPNDMNCKVVFEM